MLVQWLQAKWFVKGLDAKITDILKPTVSVVTFNDIELIMLAAFELRLEHH